MKNAKNSTLVGAFTLGGAIIFAGFLFFTGGLSSWREGNERFVIVFNENVFGLNEGGKVTLNGVKIGRVERFFLGEALEEGPVPVMIEINRELVNRHMVLMGNEIFSDDGTFRDEVLPLLVGQLVQESFVTGILYINLFTEANGQKGKDFNGQLDQLYGYPLIRSKGSIFSELSQSINLEELGKQISEFLVTGTKQLEQFQADVISNQFLELVNNLNIFIAGFSKNYLPLGNNLAKTSTKVRESFNQIEALSSRIEEAFAPDSDLRFGAVNAMHELSEMSKSLKNLADLLERNPQALLRGKGGQDE